MLSKEDSKALIIQNFHKNVMGRLPNDLKKIHKGYKGHWLESNLGGKIDAEWRRIRIPLQAFNYEKRKVNMSNIKELRLEFQRKGDLHIDNIIIVPHEHNYKKTKNTFVKVLETYPIRIGAGKEYWWGINTKHSSSPKFGDSFKYESVILT